MIWQMIEDWFRGILTDGILSNLSGLFDSVNTEVGEIATQVGTTPAGWNAGIFNMIRSLSENVIVPIAGVIITFVMCYELIQLVIEKNNLHDLDTWIFFKWIFKTFVAVLLVTNTWNIVMGVFDITQSVVNDSAGVIISDTSIDIATVITDIEAKLDAMSVGGLLGLWFQSLFVGLTMKALSICIMLVVYGRMIEIYLVTSIAPIPVIKVSQNSTQYINPMDINLNYSEGDTPIALKSDFILSFCELIMGGKNGLEAVEKTLIDRAVISVYRNYLADPKPENMPILGDLYDEIKKQPEKEAQRIAAALELYVNGSLNIFNHRTNVDIHNRLVCFDIKELGTQLKKVGMLIVQDQVWNRVTVNRSEGKATRYYIDEFHLLLKEEQTAAYSVEIWKRFRKWGGIPTGITQNVKDLLTSREVSNVFENSDFVYMLNQAQGDREILAKQLNISQQQMTYVTHSEAGEGLIFYGNVILPFIDRFPKDTELYRVMTTKPGEVSA